MRINLHLLIALLMLILVMPDSLVGRDKFTVVIDPGHGGGDAGTPHRTCTQDEKTIALNVALKLGNIITSNYRDVNVVYTRKTDMYPSLPARVQKAKSAKGDLFISIHVNACPDASVRGFETYVYSPEGSDSGKKRIEERLVEERENLDISGKRVDFDADIDIETKILCQAQREKHNKQSLQFAKTVQKCLINGLSQTSYGHKVVSRGVKAKNLFVLCFAPMPAVLIELGYMSNAGEEKFINTNEAQLSMAQSIFAAFRSYKQDWDRRQLSSADTQAAPAAAEKTDPAPTPAKAQETAKAKEPAKAQETAKAKEPAKTQEAVKAKEAAKAQETAKAKEAAKTQEAAKAKEPAKAQETAKAKEPAKADSKVAQNKGTGNVVWKIQFLTSDKILSDGARELKGLSPVTYYKDGSAYKYTYGNASSTKELSQDLKKVKALFPQAFYVKFDAEGNRMK